MTRIRHHARIIQMTSRRALSAALFARTALERLEEIVDCPHAEAWDAVVGGAVVRVVVVAPARLRLAAAEFDAAVVERLVVDAVDVPAPAELRVERSGHHGALIGRQIRLEILLAVAVVQAVLRPLFVLNPVDDERGNGAVLPLLASDGRSDRRNGVERAVP